MIHENRTDWSMRQFVDDLHYMLFMHSVTSHEASFRMRARGVPEDVARRVISSVEPHNTGRLAVFRRVKLHAVGQDEDVGGSTQ